jgi:type I restriction enzyme R subunit
MNEAQTRQQIIDAHLRLAGWNLTDPSQVIQELDIYLADAGLPVTPYRGSGLSRGSTI